MSNGLKDAAIAFGTVITLLTVWSFVEATKNKKSSEIQSKLLHAKLDLILAKMKTA